MINSTFKKSVLLITSTVMLINSCAPVIASDVKETTKQDELVPWYYGCDLTELGYFGYESLHITDELTNLYLIGDQIYIPKMDENGNPIIPKEAWLLIENGSFSLNYRWKEGGSDEFGSNSIFKDLEDMRRDEYLTDKEGNQYLLSVIGNPVNKVILLKLVGPCSQESNG